MKPNYERRTGYRSGERRGLLIRYTTSWVRVPPGPPIWRISLVVRILGFQSGEKGSIPLCAAIIYKVIDVDPTNQRILV